MAQSTPMIGQGAAGPSAWQSWMAVAVRGAGMACRLAVESSIQCGARDESKAGDELVASDGSLGRGEVLREASSMTAVEAVRMAAAIVIVLRDFMGKALSNYFNQDQIPLFVCGLEATAGVDASEVGEFVADGLAWTETSEVEAVGLAGAASAIMELVLENDSGSSH